MALFGKRDALVPMLTRVCQVEDDEIDSLIWQIERNQRHADFSTLENHEQIQSDLRELIYQEKTVPDGPLSWPPSLPEEDKRLHARLILEARINDFKRLRQLTKEVMEGIANAPEGEILIDFAGRRDAQGIYNPPLLAELNQEMRQLTPTLVIESNAGGGEAAYDFWLPARKGDLKKIPRRFIVRSYDKELGFYTHHLIRTDLMRLLTESYDQKVKRCPVCGFPYLVTRRNQQVCSVRCRTRQAKRSQLRNISSHSLT